MKLGFHGNPGNYPLMLARALARRGHEVVFTWASAARLDRPENRYPDLAPPYPPWILDFSAAAQAGMRWREQCVRALRSCDAVVLSDTGPSLAGQIARPTVALLTGTDVIHMADPAALPLLERRAREPGWVASLPARDDIAAFVQRQRAGIAQALVVTHFARGLVPEGDRVLDDLGVDDSRRMMLLMTEPDRIAAASAPRNARVRAFCGARLNWKRPGPEDLTELDYKGTDVMVRGLGLFMRGHGARIDVRLVKKGRHVAETIELVRREGIAEHVTWLEEMSQRAVEQEFREADIVFDQLGNSVVAMAGLDAMATGRPVIANARPELLQQGAAPPVCQARTPQEVAAQLRRLVFDAEERVRVGLESRRHVARHFSAQTAARRLLERLSQAGIGPGARAEN